MSFEIPDQPIPIRIHSVKVAFATERYSNADKTAIAQTYTLRIRKSGETDWIEYVLSKSVRVFYVEDLTPSTVYEAQWLLHGKLDTTGTEVVADDTTSTVYFFRTSFRERYPLRPSLTTPLYGEDFTAALQAELDAANDYINTKDEEDSLARYLKEGVGKIVGCDLTTNTPDNNLLFLSPGYFQSGPGVGTDDANWFPGARFFSLASDLNEFEIDSENSPDFLTDGKYYGYMAARSDDDGGVIYDIIWDTTIITPRPDGRWIIGSVEIKSGLVTAIDLSVADKIPTLASLQADLNYLTTLIGSGGGGGGNGGGGGGTGVVLGNADQLKFNPADVSVSWESTYKAVLRIEKDILSKLDEKIASIQQGDRVSLERLVSDIVRTTYLGVGEVNPAALLRSDGAYVIGGKFGQNPEDAGGPINLEVDGATVESPVLERESNWLYDDTTGEWKF